MSENEKTSGDAPLTRTDDAELRRQVKRALAHIGRADDGKPASEHLLTVHLREVGDLAAAFAAAFGPEWARLAGLWHDLGKFRPGFQRYLRSGHVDAHIEDAVRNRDKTHSAAGALHAIACFEQRWGTAGRLFARPLAYAIAGHHAGLADWSGDLDDRLFGSRGDDCAAEYREALAGCTPEAPNLLSLPPGFNLTEAAGSAPSLRSHHRLARSLWVGCCSRRWWTPTSSIPNVS